MSVLKPSPVISPAAGSVPYEKAVLKLWGDQQSGVVNDWIYVSNEKIQQLVFSLPPGGRFRHSERYRTVMGADEIFYVLAGTLVLANPQTGEVHRVEEGEAAYFRQGTWHHGFNYGSTELRVLEYFAPPPSTGSSQPYARTQPYLADTTYVQDQWIGRWPLAAGEAAAGHTQRVLRDEDILWRLEGKTSQVLVGIYLSTEELTTAVVDLLPGHVSEPHVHGGDEVGYVRDGRLNMFFPEYPADGQGNGWFEMKAGDGYFVPAGTLHQHLNMSGSPVRFLFGVAPRYLPAT